MSKYTTEVRYICENYAGLTESVGFSKVEEIISSARTKVFDFDYPIFDEDYRGVLETKILRHFYTREICAETVGLWKLWLSDRMNMIMPYYNQLYKSELLEFNPLYDVDMTRDYKLTKDGTKTDTGSTSGSTSSSDTAITSNETDSRFLDTPQGRVDSLENSDYLTNVSFDKNNGETTNTGSSTSSAESSLSSVMVNTDEYLEHVKGKASGTSYSKKLEEYRATFLNIDMQIINELNDLFMNLW